MKVFGIEEGGIAQWNEARTARSAVDLGATGLALRFHSLEICEANPETAIRVGDRVVAVDKSVGKNLIPRPCRWMMHFLFYTSGSSKCSCVALWHFARRFITQGSKDMLAALTEPRESV